MTIQQKIPLSRSLPQMASKAAQDEQSQIGQSLPGHVAAIPYPGLPIVTVNFDVEGATLPKPTMAMVGSKYLHIPIQVGDQGFAIPADAYLGGVTGLGASGSTAGLTQWGNLSNLVWIPLGNKNWTPVSDTTATVLTSADGKFVITCGNSGVTISYNGTTLFKVDTANVTINNKVFLNHEHTAGTYVAPGGGGAVTGDSGTVL